jgi:hypothetical protein
VRCSPKHQVAGNLPIDGPKCVEIACTPVHWSLACLQTAVSCMSELLGKLLIDRFAVDCEPCWRGWHNFGSINTVLVEVFGSDAICVCIHLCGPWQQQVHFSVIVLVDLNPQKLEDTDEGEHVEDSTFDSSVMG